MVVKDNDVGSVLSRKSEDDVSIATTKDDIKTKKYKIVEASPKGKILYRLIKEKKWNDIDLEECESETKEWIEEKNEDQSSRWKSLLIHLVCELKPPAKVVTEFLRCYPKSVSVKNSAGDLPIHIACREGASNEVIEELLLGDGYEAAKVVDCEGRLPLHIAVGNKTNSLKTIQTLISVYDRAARTPDDFSLLPLHWACSKNSPSQIVEALIQAYPYAVEAEDAWGRTPLALAKLSKSAGKAQTIELLSRDISSWTTALMSTVVKLSNKVLEFEQKEASVNKQLESLNETSEVIKQKEETIEKLNTEMKALEERYKDEMENLEKKHAEELEKNQEENDEVIAKLTKEKEDAEKKLADLKKLVDEVVAQLREHQALVEEKEASRKKLKHKAVELLKKIEKQKEETRAAYHANSLLKKECIDLQEQLDRKNEHLDDLESAFSQPLKSLAAARSKTGGSRTGNESRADLESVRSEGVPTKLVSAIDEKEPSVSPLVLERETSHCTKLDDGSEV